MQDGKSTNLAKRMQRAITWTALGLIALSAFAGLLTLARQFWQFYRTQEWEDYSLIDVGKLAGIEVPHLESGNEALDYFWDAICIQGSVTLILLMYLPLLLLGLLALTRLAIALAAGDGV